MFFLLAIWDFIFILGLILHFFVILDSFHRYTTFGRCDGPEKDQVFGVPLRLILRPLSQDPPCQLDVFGHDGHPLSMHSAKVSILEEAYQVCPRGLLKHHYCPTLEPDVYLAVVLSKLSHQSLEWQLPDE